MTKKHAAAVVAFMVAGFVVGRYSVVPRQHSSSSTAAARHILYYVDPMHPSYRSSKPGTAPDCGMQLEAVYAPEVNASSINLAGAPAGSVAIDAAVQQTVGIQVAQVEKSSGPHTVRLLGYVMPEDTLVYRVDSGTDGFVRETYNDSVGTLVKKDQKLAACYGPEYLSVASGYLAAIAGVPGANGKDGSRTMPFPGAVAKQGVSSLQGYTDRLRNLGMSEAQLKQMAESRQLPESVDVVSPADGFILSRNITPGQHFDRSMEFYRIADLSHVWIVADIFESDAQTIRPGSIARITSRDGAKTFSARVSNVLPQVDPATRTLKLRLEADNPGFALRPDMFVDVELGSAMPAALTVPADAIINSGREQRVFVESSSGVFEPRTVQTGWHVGDRVEIVRGLSEGERIVAEGTFLVDSESRLKFPPQSEQRDQHFEGAPIRAIPAPVTHAEMDKMNHQVHGAMIHGAAATTKAPEHSSLRLKLGPQTLSEHYMASTRPGQGHD